MLLFSLYNAHQFNVTSWGTCAEKGKEKSKNTPLFLILVEGNSAVYFYGGKYLQELKQSSRGKNAWSSPGKLTEIVQVLGPGYIKTLQEG